MEKEYEDKTKELVEKLEKGILDTLNSNQYKEFLKFQSQFHNYSFNNQMLIYLQKPEATNVAGFKSWQKFERHVMKGEKGISILAPNPYKYLKNVETVDKKTGEVKTEKVETQGMSFRKVSVFDVSQTDGKELPEICKELQGNSINAESIIKAIKKISEIPIIEKIIESGAKGYYSRTEDLIAINKGMSLDQTAKTLIHEYAHSKLHNTEAALMMDRATKEVQAESVAFIVSNHFGVDTSQYSFDYLASWSSGKELTELRQSLDIIQKTSDKIISKIENVITKEIELRNEPVKVSIVWTESPDLEQGQIFAIDEASKRLEHLDRERQEQRKANEKYDYSQTTVGENPPYVSYYKTKIAVELADGRISEARFDLGESGYDTLTKCIAKECGINIDKYIKEYKAELEAKENNLPAKVAQWTIREKIIDTYKNEFSAIKNISDKTAQIIDNLNKSSGRILEIKEIKELYNKIGKKLETNYNKEDLQEFKNLTEVIDDLKKAKLNLRQEQAHEKVLSSPVTKNMELVQ